MANWIVRSWNYLLGEKEETPNTLEKKDHFLEIEKKLKEDIVTLLGKKGTYVSMAPLSNKFFVRNKALGCTILISGAGQFVKIANHDFKYGWSFREDYINDLIRLATDWIEDDRNALEDELFNNEMELLDNLKSRIVKLEDIGANQ